MYTIEFYEKENGESDVWDFLEELRTKAIVSRVLCKLFFIAL